MPEKLKGDDVTVRTRWTGSLYDSSYYFNPYMEKYRIDGQVKLPFFLTPDKHYVGVAWYQKTVQVPTNWKANELYSFWNVLISKRQYGSDRKRLECRTVSVYHTSTT